MPQGSISSSDDAVGVGVVNYRVPIVETKAQVLDNCKNIANFVEGMKRGYPGLDLIVFPEHTTQGFHPTKWSDLTTTLGGDEVQIFSEACKNTLEPVFAAQALRFCCQALPSARRAVFLSFWSLGGPKP